MEKLLLTHQDQQQQQQQQHLLNLKATELRLGLPGSESPEKRTNNNNIINGGGIIATTIIKKRGFSDTINAPSATWVFSENGGGSEVKNGPFFTSSSSSPRCCESNKNPNSSAIKESGVSSSTQVSPASNNQHSIKPQVVGWPPIRSFRKNSMAAKNTKSEDDSNAEMGTNCVYVKVSMDGAPYLRKIDLKIYSSYLDLSKALEKMFSSFTLGQKGEGLTESPFMALLNGSEYVLTYEDKDGDLMLVGDVPWE
ncbi:hypothetical protein OSB04_015175 [Centaurea solstitialis]|uniref:Auxin-responsive protein n=1 Tax=Centaurea solstitialis TaxID=347529 RepID=A0AA38SYH8_9ASTR|nr:hypothetical protein OSB04_015175 [Centaurea solstitialis]